MKKFIFAMFLGLLMSSQSFSQNLTNWMWQWQNPGLPSVSSLIIFGKEGKMSMSEKNLANNEKVSHEGTWTLEGNKLIIKLDNNQNFLFTVTWVNKNKVIFSASDGCLIYAQSGSPEDRFMTNYINYANGYGYAPETCGGQGTSVTPKTQPAKQTCYTCLGTGTCKVCKGTKITSYYGYTNPCSACNQTGRCWHCNGSGIQ